MKTKVKQLEPGSEGQFLKTVSGIPAWTAGPGGMQVALFTFTHASGSASTGALGFTPKFAIYTGITEYPSGDYAHTTGVIKGTGADARATGIVDRGGNATVAVGAASDADAAAGSIPVSAFGSAFGRELDVTVFDSSGVTLVWNAAVTTHRGFLLVVGE